MNLENVSGLSGYDVQIKAGECNISKSNWEMNDFPFWKYFEEATSAECLNDWKPKGPDVSEWSSYPQNGAKSIGESKITILMPESLKKKMDEDSAFAERIMEKVSNWKANYDKYDKAIGISLGSTCWEMDVAHQTGDYLIELDENGDIENYIVTSSSDAGEFSDGKSVFVYGDDEDKKKGVSPLTGNVVIHMINQVEVETEPDYITAMGILTSSSIRIKPDQDVLGQSSTTC